MSKAYGISNHKRLIFQGPSESQIFTCLLHRGKGFIGNVSNLGECILGVAIRSDERCYH